MKLKALIKDLDYTHLENCNNYEINGISCNSQNIAPGYIFVAIKGCKHDGHNFAQQAIDKGASGVILERDLALKKKVAKIVVPDCRKALACACASFFGHPAKRLKVIGITGTNGKTTTSYLIEKILACAGQGCGVVGTVNYRLGDKISSGINTTPGADLLQPFLQEIVLAQSKYAIIEVSSHALLQHRVEGIDFSTAIFTNLSREHLDYHKNINQYFQAKAVLFKGLTVQARAIINNDDPWAGKLINQTKAGILTYGIERRARIQAKNLSLGLKQSAFSITTPRGSIKIRTPLIGRHNVYNILAAAAFAVAENIEFSRIASGIEDCRSVPGRLESVDYGQDFMIFIDYAHTDDALEKVLAALREVSAHKIILVFGCGGDRDKAKRPRMGKIACDLANFVIITSDNPRSESPRKIIADIKKGISKKKKNFRVVLDRASAIRQALALAKSRDIVLIAGKGHESTQVLADKTIPFNDREIVQKVVQCSQSQRY